MHHIYDNSPAVNSPYDNFTLDLSLFLFSLSFFNYTSKENRYKVKIQIKTQKFLLFCEAFL